MSEAPSPRRSVAQGTRWNAFNRLGLQALRTVLLLGLAWLLEDPADPDRASALLGVLGSAMLVREFLDLIGDFGVGQAVVRQRELDRSFLSTAFLLNVAAGLVLFVVLLATAPLVALWFADFDQRLLTGVLRWLAPSFFLGWITVVHRGVLLRELRFDTLAWINLLSTGAMLATSLVGAWLGHGVWGYVLGQGLSSLISLVLLARAAAVPLGGPFRLASLGELWSFMRNLLGFNLLNFWTTNLDRAVVGRLGDVALGHYNLTLRLVLYPAKMITSSLSAVLVSAFSRLQDDDEALRERLLRALGGVTLVAAPISGGLAALATPLIAVLLPDSMARVADYVRILAPVGLVQAVTYMMGSVYLAKGRTDWLLRWSLFTLPVFVLAMWIGARWGVVGVAWSLLVAHTALLPLSLGIPFRLVGLRFAPFLRRVLPPAACALAMTLAVLAADAAAAGAGASPILRLGLGLAVGVLVHGGAAWTLRLEAARELLMVAGLRPEHAWVRRFASNPRPERPI